MLTQICSDSANKQIGKCAATPRLGNSATQQKKATPQLGDSATPQNMKPEKRKMQYVNFQTVDEMMDYLPEDQYLISQRLRQIVLDNVPGVVEKLSYNMPFYKLHTNICYFWPGCIPWGNVTVEGVNFGFSNAYLMQDADNYLYKGKRKQVYTKEFFNVNEIDVDILKSFLQQAIYIDEEKWRMKRRRK